MTVLKELVTPLHNIPKILANFNLKNSPGVNYSVMLILNAPSLFTMQVSAL
jgi:hypothetical protein